MNNTNISQMAAAHNSLRIEPIPGDFDVEDVCIEVEALCINAGGELPRRQRILDLVQLYGVERVWNQAQYLWDRIGASPATVLKPTAWFIKSVEGNWGPPGPPTAKFMHEVARQYALGNLTLFKIPERHQAEITRLAEAHLDALCESVF